MLMMTSDCSTCLNDNAFGPVVSGCRDDFDFTITFEKAMLSITPSACFLALACLRIIWLSRKPTVLATRRFQALKLVRPYSVSNEITVNKALGNYCCVHITANCSLGCKRSEFWPTAVNNYSLPWLCPSWRHAFSVSVGAGALKVMEAVNSV